MNELVELEMLSHYYFSTTNASQQFLHKLLCCLTFHTTGENMLEKLNVKP